ncbi:glycosyltransferase [Paenibacillus sp. J22TS3]|uniref:glycosyltransferase n=1 Tax=Paenibacillus sp. J22TS3 TaxID=2807192 RepID=UPI001AFE3457|nr:glycosyltransferase [Paenibacillus sp. J22TS3]GIP21691.1 hypothetical protein J22TS3_19660 [Paenibacillus sp. J22TS3]
MSLTKVVAFCLGDIPSARIGIVEPMLELERSGSIQFGFYLAAELTREILADADIVICIRSADSYELDIVEECKEAGKLLIYYLDDDLLNIPQYASSTDYFNSDLIRNNIISIISNCNYLLTNNERLKEKYGLYTSNGVYMIKAPALLLSEINPELNLEPDPNEVVKLGFSGGTDHKRNLEQMLDVPLKVLKEKYKNKIEFEFMGASPNFSSGIEYKYIPYQSNYMDYIEQMKQVRWDIGLAPLPESDFHASKYFNKYLEYGSIGAAGVYSNVDPYKQVVVNENNGVLVDNTHEHWIKALSNLIEDSLLRKRIQTNARTHLENEFTIAQIASDIKIKLPELMNYSAPDCNPTKLKLRLGNKEVMLSKINNIIKAMGIKAPIYILKKVIRKLVKK